MKRILYCESNTDGTVGGSYYSLYYLTEGLPPNDYIPLVIFHHDHSLVQKYQRSGIDTRIWPLPDPFQLNNSLPRILKPVQSLINLNRFLILRAIEYALFLRRENVAIVHLNNSVTRNHAWILAARLMGIPCITHQRGINDHYTRLDHQIGGEVHAVICISEAVKRNLIEHGFDPARLRVIYNGLDPDRMYVKKPPGFLRQQLGIDAARPVIGILGNIKEWKGQEIVVRAVGRLHARKPDLACLLVGDSADSDRYYEQRLLNLIADHGLENNVYFTGYQYNVADWLNLMDIAVHASIKPEPFGRVLLEAMAMRKPVIGSNAGAVPEIVENNVTGLLYPPGDDKALAHAIYSLLENPNQRIAMGEAGYKRMQIYFHARENINRTLALYNELLS